MAITRIAFVLFITTFTFFVIQLSALAGSQLILGIDPTEVGIVEGNLGILTFPFFVLDNLFIFIQLATVSSEFFILALFLLPIFAIGFIWSIIEIIAIAIP